MKQVAWSSLKSERLKKTRGVSFEDIVTAELADVLTHPNRENQGIMLFLFRGYIWVVPFVETENEIFLKTLYPSRKYTKIYKEESDENR